MSGQSPSSSSSEAVLSPDNDNLPHPKKQEWAAESPRSPLPATSSLNWVNQAKNGSELAFAKIFEKFHRRLALYLHYQLSAELRAKVEVDDLLQELFLRAFRDLHHFQYQEPGSLLRWLFRIAAHVVQDAVRYCGREKRQAAETMSFRSESNPGGLDPAHSWTPSRILSSNEEIKKLMDKLDALPEDYRRVILLVKIEGLTTSEAALRMDKSRENLSLLLHRAIQRFRILVEP
jgi:RNA polymerase sigma-70 factor, ECF subfamily